MDFASAELEIIEMSYPLVGSLGVNRWGLPKRIAHVLLHHNDPFEGIDSHNDKLAALVNLSRFIVKAAGVGYARGLVVDEAQAMQMAQALGVAPSDFREIVMAKTTILKERLASEIQAFKS